MPSKTDDPPKRHKPGPDNTARVVDKGSTLGNIAREYGQTKIGQLMDEEAVLHGDIYRERKPKSKA